MIVVGTDLPDLRLLEPPAYADERGYFLEAWRDDRYAAAGVPGPFVQDNVSYSRAGVLRGLHLQHPHDQGKLVAVLRGEVFDVAVDVRVGSPTFARWVGCTLSAANRRQLYLPPGFAHGFVVTGDEALVTYKVTAHHHAASEIAVAWNDPELAIAWPVGAPVVSERDARAPRLRDLPPGRLPTWTPAVP